MPAQNCQTPADSIAPYYIHRQLNQRRPTHRVYKLLLQIHKTLNTSYQGFK